MESVLSHAVNYFFALYANVLEFDIELTLVVLQFEVWRRRGKSRGLDN